MFFVYLLVSSEGYTYVGATVNLDHRLRQHNAEITGGAKATTARLALGDTWERAIHVEGFPDWQAALQFEWRWKQLSRSSKATRCQTTPLDRRLAALDKLMSLDKSTSKAIPFKDWANPCQVVIELDWVDQLYDTRRRDIRLNMNNTSR